MARGAWNHRWHVLGSVAVLVLVLAGLQPFASALVAGTTYWFSGSGADADDESAPDNLDGDSLDRAASLDWSENAEAVADVLVNATTYYFVVTGLVDGGHEFWHSPTLAIAQEGVDPPQDPAGLVADAGDGRVDLSWEPAAAGDLVGYRVYRATEAGGPWTLLNFTPQVGTMYADTGPDNGTGHLYLVTAVDDDHNESGPGALTSATPGGTGAAIEPRTMAATHACWVRSDGSLWCWGENVWGQLGLAGTQSRTTPTRVGTSLDWTEVAVGLRDTCALRVDGSLWCWGQGTGGSTPHRVGVGTDWTAVDVGETHGCALSRGLSLWCWGTNEDGRLGDGTTTARNVPGRAGSGNDWASVSAGVTNTCGTRLDGSLWCWGRNLSGILEAGTAEQAISSPVRIGTASTWASVSVGSYDICGIRAEGTMWCWGMNGYGIAGNGGTGLRLTPGQVGSDAGWAKVSVGWFHACGVRTDGSAWCWGLNHVGQLGDGSTATRPSPVAAGSPEVAWVDVEAGADFTCGTLLGGSTRCWGGSYGGTSGE